MPQISFKSLSFFYHSLHNPLFVCFCLSFIHCDALDSLWIYLTIVFAKLLCTFSILIYWLYSTHKKSIKVQNYVEHDHWDTMCACFIFPFFKVHMFNNFFLFLLTRLKSFYNNWNRIANSKINKFNWKSTLWLIIMMICGNIKFISVQ